MKKIAGQGRLQVMKKIAGQGRLIKNTSIPAEKIIL
jgi:hypothetical protein